MEKPEKTVEKIDVAHKMVVLDAFNDENGVKTVYLRGVFDEEVRIDKTRFAANVITKRIRPNMVLPTPIATFRVVGDQHEQLSILAGKIKILENDKEGLTLVNNQLKKENECSHEDFRLLSIKQEKASTELKKKEAELETLGIKHFDSTQSGENLKQENESLKSQLSVKTDENDTNIRIIERERALKESHKAKSLKFMSENEKLQDEMSKMKVEITKLNEGRDGKK